jgi:endogenous inhibitor of DNA gyrase (YacG/DUF329 family)
MSPEEKLPKVRCPHCGKQSDWYDNPFRPFCSERCKLIDLGAWADDRYRIPGEPVPDPDEDEASE